MVQINTQINHGVIMSLQHLVFKIYIPFTLCNISERILKYGLGVFLCSRFKIWFKDSNVTKHLCFA